MQAEAHAAACNAAVIISVMVTVVSGVGIGFVIPTLQQHLQSLLDVDEFGVGLLFGLIAAAYVASSTVGGCASRPSLVDSFVALNRCEMG